MCDISTTDTESRAMQTVIELCYADPSFLEELFGDVKGALAGRGILLARTELDELRTFIDSTREGDKAVLRFLFKANQMNIPGEEAVRLGVPPPPPWSQEGTFVEWVDTI